MFRCICGLSRSVSKNNVQLRFINSSKSRTQITKTFFKVEKEEDTVEIVKWTLFMFPVTSFVLGCWQVYRLNWKIQLIDAMAAKKNADPIEWPHSLQKLDELEYRPVKVRGEFLHDKEILIGPRALVEEETPYTRPGSLTVDPKKNQGWLVVTPFRLKDTGEVILVNRGWVPQTLKPKEKRQASMIQGEVEIVGVVRLSETRAPFMPKNNPLKGSYFYRDLEQMSNIFGCLPVWLDARGISDPPDGWPIPNQTRVNIRNEHLSYIVTWFSLSAFTGVMWHRYFVRRLPLL